MTRRGTLAYYLAAWVIGCFVVSVPLSLEDSSAGPSSRAALFLTTYFFALIFGAADSLLFAFLLRRLMRWLGTHAVWAWLLAGACLALVLALLLVWGGDAVQRLSEIAGPFQEPMEYVLALVWMAPDALRRGGVLWQAPIDGAAGAVVLCLVDRAFNRPEEEPDATKPSPA